MAKVRSVAAAGKYEPLSDFLRTQRTEVVRMSFEEIERVIGDKLPRSAMRHRAWWSNTPTNSVMTEAWLNAGFRSEQVDMKRRKLAFRRVDRARTNEGAAGSTEERASGRHPLIGWMKGTLTIPQAVDLTQPADPEWGEVAYGDRGWTDEK